MRLHAANGAAKMSAHTDDFGRCLICALSAGECPHDFSATCWEHAVTYAKCWANGFRCPPPKIGESRIPGTDVSEAIPAAPKEYSEEEKAASVAELIAALNKKYPPHLLVARWVDYRHTGDVTFNGSEYHTVAIKRNGDPSRRRKFRAYSLEELWKTLCTTQGFGKGFRALEKDEEIPERISGPSKSELNSVKELLAIGLNAKDIAERLGLHYRTAARLVKRVKDKLALVGRTQPARDFGYLGEPPALGPRHNPKPLPSRPSPGWEERRELLFGTDDPAKSAIERLAAEQARRPAKVAQGQAAVHLRWHVKRSIINHFCPLCQQELSAHGDDAGVLRERAKERQIVSLRNQKSKVEQNELDSRFLPIGGNQDDAVVTPQIPRIQSRGGIIRAYRGGRQ